MGDKWIPDDAFTLKPILSNFTQNPTTVQLDHRLLGTLTLTLISVTWLLTRRQVLPTRAKIAANSLAAMAWIQVFYILNNFEIVIFFTCFVCAGYVGDNDIVTLRSLTIGCKSSGGLACSTLHSTLARPRAKTPTENIDPRSIIWICVTVKVICKLQKWKRCYYNFSTTSYYLGIWYFYTSLKR